MESKLSTAERPTRLGRGGRRYIGPKAQAAVPEEYFTACMQEADKRKCDLSDVWREVIEAGMLSTGRTKSTIEFLISGGE
jgi:hypothetical protein